jgi:hypothetical protein
MATLGISSRAEKSVPVGPLCRLAGVAGRRSHRPPDHQARTSDYYSSFAFRLRGDAVVESGAAAFLARGFAGL